MGSLQDLLSWAESVGVELNGIIPTSIPGCGTGVIATRRLKVVTTILTLGTMRLTLETGRRSHS